jgi:fermentation-respiration switch protein FrsA (DUF1100 family)
MAIYIILGVAGGLLLLLFLMTLICFLLVFYSPKRRPLGEDEYEIPKGEIYEVYRDDMIRWTREIRSMKRESFEIKSHDGLTLRGKYYEYSKDAPLEILFHGYRGNSERDLSGAVHRCFELGRNALIVDHRASGESDGHVITFGILERLDLLLWVDFAVSHFGEEKKIIITGISMGAATVMMALSENLPKNVVSALADCGYTSPKEIIIKVLRDLHLPPWLFYPFIKLGARIFGRFDLEETSAVKGVSGANIPIIFIHGEGDDFVPCSMSERLYEICSSEHKKLYTVPGVGHGLAYPAAPEGYYRSLREFEEQIQNKAE